MKNFFLIIVLSLSFNLCAQISSDRPDQTESSLVLSKSSIQIESGLSFQKDQFNDQLRILNTLFRFGLFSGVELRLNTNIVKERNGDDYTTKPSFTDVELGTKIQLLNSDENKTKIAFLSHFLIPTKDEYSYNSSALLSRILISHDITETFQIGYNIGYNKWFKYDDGEFIYTLAFSKNLGTLGIYFELFGDKTSDTSKFNWDTGLLYSVSDDLQLDFSLGQGFDNNLNYFGVGVSWMLK